MNSLKLRSAGARAGVALLAALALTLSACGSDDPSAGDTEVVELVSIVPMTGPIAFSGTAAVKGYSLAIKEINASDLLDGVELTLEERDTKSDPQTAAQETAKAVADKDVSVVFGSPNGGEAVAMSPILEKGKLPVVYTQAGSEGVVIGDYTYRATPLMSSYFPLVSDWLVEGGYKSIGIIYAGYSPTLATVAEDTIPDIAEDLGIEVVSSISTSATTQDFSAPISQTLSKKPDLVAVLQIGPANVTVMQQLRQAGYDGKVLGNPAANSGNLEPAGADGAGMVWPVDFQAQGTNPETQKFVEAYQAEYGEVPSNYAAQAYDAAYFVARALATAGSGDRTKVKDALKDEAAKPLTGALGKDLVWQDQTLQVPGMLIEWTGTEEKLLYEAGQG